MSALPVDANAAQGDDAFWKFIRATPMWKTLVRRVLLRDANIPTRVWNGDPLDWESWPIGRPGPFVPESGIHDVLGRFQLPTNAHLEVEDVPVFHIAEFSTNGQGIASLLFGFILMKCLSETFEGSVKKPELDDWLKGMINRDRQNPTSRFRLL